MFLKYGTVRIHGIQVICNSFFHPNRKLTKPIVMFEDVTNSSCDLLEITLLIVTELIYFVIFHSSELQDEDQSQKFFDQVDQSQWSIVQMWKIQE